VSPAIDITGQRFGRLVALHPTADRSDNKVVWSFRCDCGSLASATAKGVRDGNTKSCGCLKAIAQVQRASKTRVALLCPVCGKDFTVKQSHAHKSTYCSRSCMGKAYEELMIGNGNPNYKAMTDQDRLAWAKRWRAANPEKVASRNRNSRAVRKRAPGKHTQKDVDDLRERQGGLCAACKCGLHDEGHVDHIIPIAKGGSNFAGNIQLLCAQCNLHKKVMLPLEYRHRVLMGKTEDAEQSRLIEWSRKQSGEWPELAMLYHAANGGYRTKATSAKMQSLGVKKGVPDLILPVSRGGFGAMYIEMKVGKNKPTIEQAAWISALKESGNVAVVAWGWEQARDLILAYLSGEA
jgi:5-methylcytosine-specific restriction endonuclease McrA